MNYKKLNDIVGWAVFLIAFITYFLTVAPTASYWDCGEFIAVSNELEVPHPPGAPMYLLLGRIFALFAGSDVTQVAFMVNLLSVVASAFTALFTFWIVTALGKKVLAPNDQEPTLAQNVTLMFAGMVGGLTCTFADSVWFNAVEAEVYAISSFFTAIVVWLMLKWEARADEPDHLKWIILIAYVMGISIGVHLLNLLCIPALVAIYYFRKYTFSWQGFFAAMGISVVILGLINSTIIKTTFDIAWKFEKIFTGAVDITGEIQKTSGMGLPFGTGAMIFATSALALITGLLYYSYQKKNVLLSTTLLSTVMVYMGLSSYAMIMIRAKADPPINENNPGNILNFLMYMKREQYGDWPILRGEMYNARLIDIKKGEPLYYKFGSKPNPQALGVSPDIAEKMENRYVAYEKKPEYEYAPGSTRLFPRMHSSQHYTGKGYWSYENHVSDKGEDPQDPNDDNVTGLDNLKYFFKYQLDYMYIRYFLWNFVGRAGDEQFRIDDWESGVNVSKLKALPEHLRNDPARNHYYALPLILGLIGLYWQYDRNKRDAAVVGLLFFFTGLAIVLYLNQPPQQPRERDYSYAGSFQTYAIWVGLGVIGLAELLNRIKGMRATSPYIAGGVSLLVAPALMGVQNWFDHSRADNYVAPDSARNMLETCAPNAIIFTNGDNDTFPLWYIQEVEGVRSDVRIVNLSLLNTDWYIQQLKFKCNESEPLPITLDETEYMGERNAMKVYDSDVLKKVLPVDKEALLKNKVISIADTAGLPSQFEWTIKMRGSKRSPYLQKQDIVIVNMLENIAKAGWNRPFYFAITIPPSSYLNLNEYFQLEGLAYRVTPVKHKVRSRGDEYIAKDIMYENLMKKYWLRNLDRTDVFYDSNIRRMIGNMRHNYIRLASAYADEAEELEYRSQIYERMKKVDSVAVLKTQVDENRKRSKEVLDYIRKKVTDESVRTENYYLAQFARVYLQIGEKETGKKLVDLAYLRCIEELDFDVNVNNTDLSENDFNIYTLQVLYQMYKNELQDYPAAKRVAQSFQAFTGDSRMLKDIEQKISGKVEPPMPEGQPIPMESEGQPVEEE